MKQEQKQNNNRSELIRLIAEKKMIADEYGKYSPEMLDVQKRYLETIREQTPDAAEFALKDLREIYEHLEGPDSRNALETGVALARTYFEAGDYISAREVIEEVYGLYRETYGPNDRGSLEAMEWYVTILFEMELDDEALALDEAFLSLVSQTYGPASFESFRARRNHGDLLCASGKWEKARDVYLSLEHAQQAVGFADDMLQLDLFQCATELKLYSEQKTSMAKHLDNLRALGAEDIDLANAYSRFLDGFYAAGQYESALECGKALIPLLQNTGKEGKRSLASVLQTTALISCKTGDYRSALKYSERSLDIAKKVYKYDYAQLAEYQNAYDMVREAAKGSS
ncbi:MAG: tetratricopeptide repeat protein [Oscillospiraceae bacterium]|nr:tetratricopeptide repeat protein [Oscillospiraceae bacterium]